MSLVLAIFLLKFPNFRCHGNRGRSDVNSNDTGKLLDLEDPLLGATFMAMCDIGRVMANFVLKFPNVRCHGSRGRSAVNFNDTGKFPDLENPLFGATFVALFLVVAKF